MDEDVKVYVEFTVEGKNGSYNGYSWVITPRGKAKNFNWSEDSHKDFNNQKSSSC